jgi:phenylacetate-coenzyme A ligase PaaK-like adenylate-forming protein
MNDRLKVRVEAAGEILEGKEERKITLQEALQLALRRALGLRVEVELKERSALSHQPSAKGE